MEEVSETNEAVELNEQEQGNEINLHMASRWRRLGGALIDGIISSILAFIFMAQMGLLKKTYEQVPLTIKEQVYNLFFGIIVFLIIQGYLLYKRGQTVGKLMVKTKIVDINGNVPNFGKTYFLRYLVFQLISVIPILGSLVGLAEILNIFVPLIILADILLIFGPERRCLHDYVAGTYVINETENGN